MSIVLSKHYCLAGLGYLLFVPLISLLAQDTRNVSEPVFPPTCQVMSAYFQSSSSGDVPSANDNNTESARETLAIQSALNSCVSGKAVELVGSGSNNAFLINPLTIPTGVSLIVDGGVTVFGSRDPANYQASTSQQICGVIGTDIGGCTALLNFSGSNNGLYGYGVVDGRGGDAMLSGAAAGQTWWYEDATYSSPYVANNPQIVNATASTDFTLYKITLRNSPWWNVVWTGNGFTAWDVKIQGPWNISNTDGIDIWGTNATVNHATISTGDDEVVIDAEYIPAGNITIENETGYSRNGISIGSSTEHGVSNVLVQNSNLIGDVPSLAGTTVNGMTQAYMQATYGLTSYRQALPLITGAIRGLNFKTNVAKGGSISNVTFSSICMQDLTYPVTIQPFNPATTGTRYPTIQNITYQNIHILAPTSQFIVANPHATPGYRITFEGYPPGQPQPNGITMNNVVFDDNSSGATSLGQINAYDNTFITLSNIYPPVLNALAASYVANPGTTVVNNTSLILSANSYATITSTSSQTLAYACPSNPFPFTVGELYLSIGNGFATGTATNLKAAAVTGNGSVTLNAMVQPAMSQTTFFAPNAYSNTPGLLSVGAPELTQPVNFYEGGRLVGTASLGANGTLASLTLSSLTTGTHTYTAQYPGDANYGPLAFGSVTVTVTGTSTTTLLTAPSTNMYGTATVLTANVSGAGGTPTGTVTFYDGAASLGVQVLAGGSASMSVQLTGGVHLLTAIYGGDSIYLTSTSTTSSLTVLPATSNTVLTSNPISLMVNSSAVLTAAVTGVSGMAIPMGSVVFTDGTTNLGSATLSSGFASVSSSLSNLGPRTLVASYSGDVNYATSSGITVVTVTPIETMTVLSVSPAVAYPGASVSLTSSVSPAGGSGVVTFFNGTTVLGTAVASPSTGIATHLLTVGSVGIYSLTASVAATGNYAASTSTMQTLSVVPPVVVSVAPSSITISPGGSGSVTVNIVAGGGYNGPVSLTCTSPVSYITCSPSATTVTLSGTMPVTIQEQVSVAATTDANAAGSKGFLSALLMPFCLLGLALRLQKGTAKWCYTVTFVLFACGLIPVVSFVGCGGGLNGSSSNRPSGSQTITVTATAAATTETARLIVAIGN